MNRPKTISERSEQLQLDLLVDEFRRQGYTVVREPELDFLPGFRPDLVATKDGDNKVIEVKSRSSLLHNDRIEEIALAVRSRPGWSFELRIIGEPEALDAPQGAISYEIEGILSRINEAEQANVAGLSSAAFLLAWSAYEAATRELLAVHGVKNESITNTRHLFDQAVYHGVLSREDYSSLTKMMKFRNAMIHGFNVEDFDRDLVVDLILATRKISDALAIESVDNDDAVDLRFAPESGSESNGGPSADS